MKYNFISSNDPGLTYSIANNTNVMGRNNEYIKTKYNEYVNRLGTAGNMFKDSLSNMYNYFNNNNFIQNTIKNLTRTGVINSEDVITQINESNFQGTNYIMRRYIMANPIIYRKGTLNRINAYGGQWYDNENEGVDPFKRLDYLNVIDSTLQHRKDGTGYMSFTNTSEGNPLDMEDRLIIQDTWDILNNMIANDMDPTDID